LRRRTPGYCPLQAGRSSAPMPVITGPPMSGLSDPGTRRCGPAFDSRVRFAMNGLLIVFAAALMLLLPQFNNADAAGPYEGEWTGTATSTGERCKQAVVKLTVEGQVVLGQARFERDVPNINGTVDEDARLGRPHQLSGRLLARDFGLSAGCEPGLQPRSGSSFDHRNTPTHSILGQECEGQQALALKPMTALGHSPAVHETRRSHSHQGGLRERTPPSAAQGVTLP
jgi:hypothetical protein